VEDDLPRGPAEGDKQEGKGGVDGDSKGAGEGKSDEQDGGEAGSGLGLMRGDCERADCSGRGGRRNPGEQEGEHAADHSGKVVGIEEGKADEVGDLAGDPCVCRRRDVEDQHVPEVDAEGESTHRGKEGGDIELAAKALANGEEMLKVEAGEGSQGES